MQRSYYVYKWNELGGNNSCNFGTGTLKCINSNSKGNVYIGEYFTIGNKAYNMYTWTKSTNEWTAFYTYENPLDINTMAFDKSDTLYVAGKFTESSGNCYVAKYHVEKWSNYENLNANNAIQSIRFDNDGNMYAGGDFTNKDTKYYVATI